MPLGPRTASNSTSAPTTIRASVRRHDPHLICIEKPGVPHESMYLNNDEGRAILGSLAVLFEVEIFDPKLDAGPGETE